MFVVVPAVSLMTAATYSVFGPSDFWVLDTNVSIKLFVALVRILLLHFIQ